MYGHATHVCMYVRLSVGRYVCMYVCIYASMHLCTYVCTCLCVACLCVYLLNARSSMHKASTKSLSKAAIGLGSRSFATGLCGLEIVILRASLLGSRSARSNLHNSSYSSSHLFLVAVGTNSSRGKIRTGSCLDLGPARPKQAERTKLCHCNRVSQACAMQPFCTRPPSTFQRISHSSMDFDVERLLCILSQFF